MTRCHPPYHLKLLERPYWYCWCDDDANGCLLVEDEHGDTLFPPWEGKFTCLSQEGVSEGEAREEMAEWKENT